MWLHPHVHCIVPNGGITKDKKWETGKNKDKYLYPKRALSMVFRENFMELLRKKIRIPQKIVKQAFAKKWVVYTKRPFSSPKTVVEYLGRYTHTIAISNHRLTDVNDKTVSFEYKDYKDWGKKKRQPITGLEFLRRFSSHILRSGFVRI
jgi:hypothetical protein